MSEYTGKYEYKSTDFAAQNMNIQTGQATSDTGYQTSQHPCPTCGRCPTCGVYNPPQQTFYSPYTYPYYRIPTTVYGLGTIGWTNQAQTAQQNSN